MSHPTSEQQGRCDQPDCQHCRRVNTVCYMCSSECGLELHERGGQIVGVFGDPDHPMNRGTLCPKAFGTLNLLSKDRIKTPLRRVGPRGQGHFEPISWETALNEIAQRLVHHKQRVGPHSLLIQFGEKPDHDMVYRFANAYGTPNVLDHDSICDTNRRQGFMFTYGASHFRPLPDFREAQDCRYLLLIGENPMEATRFLYLRNGIRAALKKGKMHLTVVDPFKSATAKLAHDWLAVRPGSDLALVLAILRYVVEHDRPDEPEQRYLDHDFIRQWTIGFEALTAELLNGDRYSVAWAAEQTGLAAETIRRIAHEFGRTKPAAAMVGMNGVGHHRNGFLTTRAVAMLVAITGNLDVPGGLALAPRPPLATDEVHARHQLTHSQAERHKDRYAGYPLAYSGIKAKDPQDILEGVSLTQGRHAGEHYPLKSLFVIHGNPLINAPNSGLWREALTRKVRKKSKGYERGEEECQTGERRVKSGQEERRVKKEKEKGEKYLLDLVVFNDTMISDTGLYADYILPMASYIERQGISRPYINEPTVSLRRPVVPPYHQSRTPLQWIKALSEACVRHGDESMREAIPYETDDEWCNALLQACPSLRDKGEEESRVKKESRNAEAPLKVEKLTVEKLSVDKLSVDALKAEGGTVSWPTRYYKYDQLDTPSGKVELSSQVITEANQLFNLNYEPLIAFQHNDWNPNNPDCAHLKERFPFQLITGRSMAHTGSFTQNLERSKKMMSKPHLWMNRNDAQRLALQEHDQIELSNPQGARIIACVSLTDDLLEGVVRAQHGWGQRSPFLRQARGCGYNINELTDDQVFNEITGNAGFGDMMVAIKRMD